MQRYLSGIQARCLAVWGEELDWDKRMRERTRQEPQDSGPPPQQDEPPAADDGLNRVREAHARGNWLYRFRTTFVDGNRLALVFELNWFERLCREGASSLRTLFGACPRTLGPRPRIRDRFG
ncbi:hypothetical protein AAFM48_08125 [Burkholderia pseudomallei]